MTTSRIEKEIVKRWLVIKNEFYYPCAGTDDWLKIFYNDELDDAKTFVNELEQQEYPGTVTIVDIWEWIGIAEEWDQGDNNDE